MHLDGGVLDLKDGIEREVPVRIGITGSMEVGCHRKVAPTTGFQLLGLRVGGPNEDEQERQ